MKGIDYINKKISTHKELNLKLVERINRFYWKEGIKKTLIDTDEKSVYIRYIGSIDISYFKIKQHILHKIGLIRSIPNSSKFREETKKDKIGKLREELKKLLTRRNELATFYYNENLRHGRYPRISKVDTEVFTESRTDN